MKNILYIGPYRESNGLGKSSKRFVDSLISNTNINLSIRPVFYTKIIKNHQFNTNSYVEFEENSFKYYDAIIQHGCPIMFEYHKYFGKNIAICEVETNKIGHTGWIEKINMMDEVIVGSVFSLNSLSDSGVTTPIRILPEPYNLYNYSQKFSSFFKYRSESKPFIFYTIGPYNEKKNIKGIVLAFLLEFNKRDNVKLFIKTGTSSDDNEDIKKLIDYDIQNIKNIIRKNNSDTPDIDIVCGYLEDVDIIRLHQTADCYVNAVRSDGFGSSAIEAMLSNSVVINTKNVGSNTYINNHNGVIIDSSPTNVYSASFFDKNTFTIYEEWYEPNISSLRSAMRSVYESKTVDRDNKILSFDKDIFDHKLIGKSII